MIHFYDKELRKKIGNEGKNYLQQLLKQLCHLKNHKKD